MNKIRALLAARYKSLWRMIWRGNRITPAIGLIIGLGILAVISGACALVVGSVALNSPASALGFAALIIAALQLFTLMGAGLSGRFGIFNDPRPLLPYPLSGREWAASAVIGQSLDMGVLYALAGLFGLGLGLLLAGPAGWGGALLLFAGHFILAAQTVGLSGIIARFSQSRRFRDARQIALIGLSLSITAAYFFLIFPSRTSGQGGLNMEFFKRLAPLSPSGALLTALAGGTAGDPVRLLTGLIAALLHFALAVALVAGAVYLARRESGGSEAKIGRARFLPWLLRPLPAPMAAFLLKDLAYLRREPGLAGRLVGNLLNSLLLIGFVAFSPIGLKSYAGPYYFFMALSSLAAGRMILYNQWGYEGPGIRFLLISGAPGWQLIAAKWLLGLLVVALDATVKAVVLAIFLPAEAKYWLIFGTMIALAPLGAAIGSYISIRQPWPMLGRGRLRAQSQAYDWTMIPINLAARAVFFAAGSPVLLLGALIYKLDYYSMAPVAVLFSAGYAAVLSIGALPWLAGRFAARRPELLERLAAPEENL